MSTAPRPYRFPSVSVLQSGFIANTIPDFEKTVPNDPDATINALMLGRHVKDTTSPYFYSKEIDSVFAAFKQTPKLALDFDFRERFFKAIKTAMDNKSFMAWCYIQSDSPHLSSLHKRFINDTLNYLVTGKRDLNLETWAGLIEAHGVTDNDNRADYAVRLFDEHKHILGAARLAPTITVWLQRPNGLYDLFWFFGIVFGQHSKFMAG